MSAETTRQRRQIVLLIASLALTELLVGVSSVCFLRKTDALYSELIDRKAPILRQLRELAQESSNIHRYSLNLLLVAENPSEVQVVKEKLAKARVKNTQCLREIEHLNQGEHAEQLLIDLKTTGEWYSNAADSLVQLVSKSQREQALAFKTEIMSPAFEAYQSAQTALAEYTDSSFTKANDAATAQTKWMERIVVGFTSAPFLIGLGLLLMSVAYFVYFICSVREASD